MPLLSVSSELVSIIMLAGGLPFTLSQAHTITIGAFAVSACVREHGDYKGAWHGNPDRRKKFQVMMCGSKDNDQLEASSSLFKYNL